MVRLSRTIGFVTNIMTLLLALYLSDTTGQVTVTPLVAANFTGGLYWDCDHNVLLYLEKDAYEMHRLDITTYKDQTIKLDQLPSFVIPTKGNNQRFVMNQENDIFYLFWPYDSAGGYYDLCLIASVDYNYPGLIFNDARADACGRVWSGTYPLPDLNGNYPVNQGTLYRIDARTAGKACITPVLRPVTFSNDLTWTLDNKLFYFSESDSACIYSFCYDLENGVISQGRRVFCFADFNIIGLPDGICLDSINNLWIAANGAGLVLNINPATGQLLRTVTIPARSVIDVEFGGLQLDILYVSTRNVGDPLEPLAGSIFQVTGLNTVSFCERLAVMNSDCTPEFLS